MVCWLAVNLPLSSARPDIPDAGAGSAGSRDSAGEGGFTGTGIRLD
jgi:hypothetical protein